MSKFLQALNINTESMQVMLMRLMSKTEYLIVLRNNIHGVM